MRSSAISANVDRAFVSTLLSASCAGAGGVPRCDFQGVWGSPSVHRVLLPSVLALACALSACGGSGGSTVDHRPTRMIGAAEDAGRQPDSAVAEAQMEKAAQTGFNTIRLTQMWTTGERMLNATDQAALENALKAARARDIRVILSIYPTGSSVTPTSAETRAQFAAFVSDIAQRFPDLDDFIVGNEPNINRFWMPQFGATGDDVAAAAYEQLLAATYDAVKQVRAHATVYGGALAPRGSDKPDTGRDTHSPTTFIADLGTAYKSSGRTRPIMDAFTIHPYPETSSTGATLAHPHSTSIGLADHAKLVRLLGAAFDGTGQEGSHLPVLYDEFGVETAVPAGKAGAYTGTEPQTTHPVDERAQARIYAQALDEAACQRNVLGLLLFHVTDEAALTGWQSGEFYADGSPKTSLEPVRVAVGRARHGCQGQR
jgi:hypothetical protein